MAPQQVWASLPLWILSAYGAVYAPNGLIADSFDDWTYRLVSAGVFAWLTILATPIVGRPIVGRTANAVFRALALLAALALGTSGFTLIMRYGPDGRVAK